jgi:hypothetical protein
MCEDVGMRLKMWNGALASIHAKVPDIDHCNHTQDQIDKAIAHTWHMGISIIRKIHGMEWKCMSYIIWETYLDVKIFFLPNY